MRDVIFVGNSIIPRRSDDEPSIENREYEMVAEFTARIGDSNNLPPHIIRTAREEGNENHSEEYIEHGGYSSLQCESSAAFAQPAVYTNLHLYANINVKEI